MQHDEVQACRSCAIGVFPYFERTVLAEDDESVTYISYDGAVLKEKKTSRIPICRNSSVTLWKTGRTIKG